MAKTLEDDLAEAFARWFPFTAKEVKRLYRDYNVGSWDFVHLLCEWAVSHGYTDLMQAFSGYFSKVDLR